MHKIFWENQNISSVHSNIDNSEQTITEDDEWFRHISGFDNIVLYARNLLKQAKTSVYINADFPVSEFKDELKFLIDNNVNVTLFSFYEAGKVPAGVHVYSHNHKMKITHVCKRLMIAVDEKEALLADRRNENGEWHGTLTNNELMVSVVCEHIHNDIYLMQLRKEYGREIYEGVKTGDEFEKGRLEKGIY